MPAPVTILSKEAIAARMFKHAARYWEYKDTNVDNFDPLVRLLIEACAVELFKIGNEIASVEERMLEKLAQLLTPEVHTGPRPAHAVLHARSAEPMGTTYPEMQFFHQKKVASKGAGGGQQDAVAETYFSPAGKFRIFDGDVALIACGEHVYTINDSQLKEDFLTTQSGRGFEPKTLWLGIELNEEVKQLNGLSFFVDLRNHPDRFRLQKLIKYTKWSANGSPLHMESGLHEDGSASGTDDLFYDLEEFDINKSVLGTVRSFYAEQFVTVREHQASAMRRERYPPEFEEYLSLADLSKFQQNLLWVKATFLPEFDEQVLDEVAVHINCFPVLNRRLNEIRYRVQTAFNIIPLLSSEQFMSLHRVQGSEGADHKDAGYVSTPFDDRELRNRGTYTLRTGQVERFDDRSAVEYLNYLVELLRDESRAFAALGQDFVISLIKDLNQNIAQIEQKVKQNVNLLNQAPVYLVVNPRVEGDNVFVEFWSTGGESSNGIRSGSRLEVYLGAEVQAQSLLLVTGTTGGRDKMKNTEVLNAYKSSLMTRGRLVTLEDVRSYCAMVLNDKARRIEVKKGVGIGHLPGEGLVHTIDVQVTRGGAQAAEEEWQNIAHDLESRLREHSAAWVNYRVMVN
jgi:hypothetical protein